MSERLKTILKPKIKSAFEAFGENLWNDDITTDTPRDAQNELVELLSDAIAKGVQEYINDYVKTIPVGGPVIHEHRMIAP